MKLTLNKLKVLSLVMVLSLAPSGIAKAQSDATATNCTINYSGDEPVQQCYGGGGETSSDSNFDSIIYEENTSPTKIPEPSTTVGILMAVSLGYISKRKKLAEQR